MFQTNDSLPPVSSNVLFNTVSSFPDDQPKTSVHAEKARTEWPFLLRPSMMMAGLKHITVDSTACVLLTSVHRIVKRGIERLKHLFSTYGFCARPDNAVNIEICGNLHGVLQKEFSGEQ